MVRPNLWIDRKPSERTAVASQQASYGSGSQAGTWATGRVLDVLDGGMVRVELPADDPVSEVVAPADGGVTAVGAECVCLQDGTGRVYQVVSPAALPEGGQARATGATGKIALEAAGTKAELDAAKAEIDAAQKRLSEEVKAAKDAAATSGEAAANALKRAIGRVTVAGTAPADPVDGDLWVVTGADKQATGVKVWSAAAKAWQDYMLVAGKVLVPGSVGAVQLADGAVTAPKITASDELWAKVATFAKVTTQMLQAGQARITGELLADTIRLSTRIVAGDPSGDAAIMDSTGLHVVKAVGGQPSEVVTLGTAGRDFLSITGTDGLAKATITGDGEVTSQSLSVADRITWKGTDLADTLAALPRGVIAHGTAWPWGNDTRHIVSHVDSLFELVVDVEAGRQYQAEMVTPWFSSKANAMLEVWLRYAPVNGGSQVEHRYRLVSENLRQIQTGRAVFQLWTPPTSGTYRLLFLAASAYGDAAVTLTVEDKSLPRPYALLRDLGAAVEPTLQINKSVSLGKTVPQAQPTPKRNRRSVYPATWWKAYSNGVQDNAWTDSLPQGIYGGRTYNSLVGFQDMTGDLRGATITNMQLYCYARHWYGQTGTATIGVHGWWQGIPGAFSSNGQWGEFSGWGRGEGRWVTIPKYLWPAFQNGTHRGISFQTGANSSYGYFDKNVQIAVDYIK
nr:MAG TPA: hypothetical protein [Caudoviricetes sp.]DAR93621.1 MAG TPA: hypothetical protein [Caudoviricetes sp.]